MTTEKQQWEQVPPDTMIGAMQGTVDGEWMRAWLLELRDHSRARPRIYMVVDISQLAGMTSDARRVAAELAKEVPWEGIAAIGGSVVVRALVTMLARVVNLLAGKDRPLVFVRDREEGLAWVANQRKGSAS